MHKRKIQGRHGARYFAVQALYSVLMGTRLSEVEVDLLTNDFMFGDASDDAKDNVKDISCDVPYFKALVHGVVADQKALDDLLAPYLDRKASELTPIEYAILLIGIYELSHHPETPYKVIINEAILMAKTFGAQDAHKYINGVLDKAAKVYSHSNKADLAAV